MKSGHMTLPVETGHEDLVFNLSEQWKADALRDSDGTAMPAELASSGADIYSTVCLVRADQEYADSHREYLHRKYLMSFPVTPKSGELFAIDPLKGYSKDKYEIDDTDPMKWWEVRDRTTGNILSPEKWYFESSSGEVCLREPVPFHEYTVSFMARQIWDSVSMYNHLTNGWTGRRIKSLDPYHRACRDHLKSYFRKWLDSHPHTTVVRFTTFAFNFVIDSGEENQDIYRDWLGYGETVSPQALEDFEKEYGYRLTPEDFVDSGYYNATYKVPSKRYRDWMDFINRFVMDFSSELIEMAHKAGKKCAMFQGDHWIGTEPYSPGYEKLSMDIDVGAVEDGVALRRLSDSPGNRIREARFYPYFFPDVFRKGNDPVEGSLGNWLKIRRALLQQPIDRIGYGGYLSLAALFPDFIDHVGEISRQFGAYKENTGRTACEKIPLKIGILNAWGKWRSWLQNPVRDQRFHVPERPDIMEFVGSNPMESLAGLPFDISFFSFDDMADKGIPSDLDIIINMGDSGSAWSGGDYWTRPEILTAVREFISGGGGFLGIGDPSASQARGRFFQLGDVLGVEKETSLTMGRVAAPVALDEAHDLRKALTGAEDFGRSTYVYNQSSDLSVLSMADQHITASANEYGMGRSVYLGSLPFSRANAAFLTRVLIWLGQLESRELPWLSDNPYVDCAYYRKTGMFCLVNSDNSVQEGEILKASGSATAYRLQPYEWKWYRAE